MEHITLQYLVRYIRNELQLYYPWEEIKSLSNILLQHFLKTDMHKVYIHPDTNIEKYVYQQIASVVNRLQQYEPVQYILGETEFYGIHLKVNPSVLIPRQESEELVEWIINQHGDQALKILDIGTGSGCLALALAASMPKASVLATEHTESAVQVARENASRNHLNVKVIRHDIFRDRRSYSLDLIVSNPPYVTESEKSWMSANVLHYEPHHALFVPDTDPLVYYRAIAAFARKHLKQGGMLYVEINEAFGDQVCRLFQQYGFTAVTLQKDLNGKDRMIGGKNSK